MKNTLRLSALIMAVLMFFTACNQKSENPDVSSKKDLNSNSSSQQNTSSDLTESEDPFDESNDNEDEDIEGYEPDEDYEDEDEEEYEEEDLAPLSFKKLSPAKAEWTETLTPTFTWSELEGASSYVLQIDRYKDGVYRKIKEYGNIKALSYTMKDKLAVNEFYRWRVYGIVDGVRILADKNSKGNLFVAKFNPKEHPANKDLDFNFKGSISEKVLNNYLSRVMSIAYADDHQQMRDNLRVILYTGAKYISRAVHVSSFMHNEFELLNQPMYKEAIDFAHKYDPDIIFEGGIFEIISKDVADYKIPAYVFEAFGLPVEDRGFDFEAMKSDLPHLSGEQMYSNSDLGTPDITKVEAQMWFYFRATRYIDLGFEACHMGVFGYITASDTSGGFPNYTKVMNMIRDYAKTHARRGFFLINSHTHGVIGSDGLLIFDFHAWTIIGKSPAGSVPGPATPANPQKIIVEKNFGSSIYGKSLKGKTHSGWTTGENGLPYTVELDNVAVKLGFTDQPTFDFMGGNIWGVDEMGWFRNQPSTYRAQWLQYVTNTVYGFDPNIGHVMMPGFREASQRNGGLASYRINNPEWGGFSVDAFNDEEAVRKVFISSRERLLGLQ